MAKSPSPSAATIRLSLLALLGAMLIYGAGFPISRYATLHGMRPEDIVVLRYSVAGPLMLPLFIQRGICDCAGIGWPKGIVLFVTSGVPMALLMNIGLSLAPAAHGAALSPGTVTVVGVIYGIFVARGLPPRLTLVGLALMLSGLGTVALSGSTGSAPSVVLGDLCFFASGLLWGFYPVVMLRWRVAPMTGTAIVAVLSAATVPLYMLFAQTRLFDVEWSFLLAQAVFQGVFTVIGALWLWGWAMRNLGPEAQLLPPLIPLIGTVLAVPILGEVPGALQAAGFGLIFGGLIVTALSSQAAARRARRELTGL